MEKSNLVELTGNKIDVKNLQCSPKAVGDAARQLGASEEETKNALANCTANIQAQEGDKLIRKGSKGENVLNSAYLDLLNDTIWKKQTELAKMLGLHSVVNAMDAKASARSQEYTQMLVKAQQAAAEKAAAAKQKAADTPEVKTAEAGAPNYYAEGVRKVFGRFGWEKK